ncbi:MAG: membrane integrity-associated transporter subunit PqiC [Magnetococcales bacterium]|nr:membrane integrity-associated transporter subunit PqiC [Magnetococcales bacterium]
MKTTSGWLLYALLGATLVLVGCPGPTSPPTRYFLLTAQTALEPGTKPVEKPRTTNLVVELEPVEIPQYLNRPEMVTRVGGNRLRLERLSQWAGDLKEDLGRIAVENLSVLLGSDRITVLPNRAEQRADFRIATSINRFEPDENGLVTLDARWTLFNGPGKLLTSRHARIATQSAQSDDAESLAEAMSQAMARLHRDMATEILNQPRQ